MNWSTVRWFLLAAAAVVAVHVVALGPAGRRSATVGEASTAAAAFAQARLDGSQFAVPWVDRLAVNQLAALDVLTGGLRGGTVLDGARAVSLAASLLTCLLLWVVARRLGFRPPAAAAAVALAGMPAALVSLHGAVDAGVLAALWLTVAAAIPGGNLPLRLLAATAAVLTAPLAAVGLLVFITYLVVTGVVFLAWRPALRLVVTVVLVDTAVLVAVLATGERSLAVLGDAAVPASTLLAVAGVGFAVTVAVWWLQPWLRPVAVGAAAMLGCALVPGPAAGTALLIALPAAGGVGAGLFAREARPPAPLPTVAGAARRSFASCCCALRSPVTRSPDAGSQREALAAWIVDELDQGTIVAVDELGWAQLVHDGVPAGQLVAAGPLAATAPPPEALLAPVDRPGHRTGWEPAGASVPLAATDAGPGDAPVEVGRQVHDPVAANAQAEADRADRARFGAAMAGNPALALGTEAAGQLRTGDVDTRLMTVLATFASTHRVTVDRFLAAPLDGAGQPRRTAAITAIDGREVIAPDVADLAHNWFTAQLPPYRPLSVRLVTDALLVRYAAPAPLGLLAR